MTDYDWDWAPLSSTCVFAFDCAESSVAAPQSQEHSSWCRSEMEPLWNRFQEVLTLRVINTFCIDPPRDRAILDIRYCEMDGFGTAITRRVPSRSRDAGDRSTWLCERGGTQVTFGVSTNHQLSTPPTPSLPLLICPVLYILTRHKNVRSSSRSSRVEVPGLHEPPSRYAEGCMSAHGSADPNLILQGPERFSSGHLWWSGVWSLLDWRTWPVPPTSLVFPKILVRVHLTLLCMDHNDWLTSCPALAATGFIWVRYSLVITPINYSLAAVRIYLCYVGLPQFNVVF